MRCKACNVELKDIRDRDVGDGIIVMEDLCHKCRTIALYDQEAPDDDLIEILGVEYGTYSKGGI
jgi:hypothetical protein